MKSCVLSGQEKERIAADIEETVNNLTGTIKVEKIRKYASLTNESVCRYFYLYLGKLYRENPELREKILILIKKLLWDDNEHVRETAVYTLGEIEL